MERMSKREKSMINRAGEEAARKKYTKKEHRKGEKRRKRSVYEGTLLCVCVEGEGITSHAPFHHSSMSWVAGQLSPDMLI